MKAIKERIDEILSEHGECLLSDTRKRPSDIIIPIKATMQLFRNLTIMYGADAVTRNRSTIKVIR